MKIAVISNYLNACPALFYGSESYYWHIAKWMAEQGHEVHLFAAPGSLTPPNGYLHYLMHSPEGQIDYGIERWAYETYKDILLDMDIIHDCSPDHITTEHLRYLHNKKEIVNTINGTTYWMPRPKPFNVVTGSKWWQQDALDTAGLKTEMVYWGSDTEFYTPGGEKEDYFLWIARFHPDKGLDLALDLAEYLGFHLKVAGSLLFKDHAAYGREYIKRINSIKNVEYVDLPMDSTHHEFKRELYRKARAFLFPPKYRECFGLVITEAMACGTPVISVDYGSPPEIIDDGINGFICHEKRDFVEVITKKLDEHNNDEFRGNVVKKAKHFDVRNAARDYEKLYEEVIGGKSW